MRISVYTAIKNSIANDLHAIDMVRHHLPLADEIVINEGFSTDGTFERIRDLDPKVKIVRTVWETPKDQQWCLAFKDAARLACTGDWCIHLDCDEFIPEWEFADIRAYLERATEPMIPVEFVNFYGNYKVYHAAPERVRWPARKMIIHRNIPEIEFWGDASNVKMRDVPFDWNVSPKTFSVHHFGMVRDAATLRQKWWIQGRAVSGRSTLVKPPKMLFKLFPHKWDDPQYFHDLAIYDGPVIQAVKNNPNEFVRDRFSLHRQLLQRPAKPIPASVHP